MKILILYVLMVVNLHAQVLIETRKSDKRSMIEAGSFLSFSSYKERQIPGIYLGYWYRYPIDENKAHLEFGLNFYHSGSQYNFEYEKKGLFYNIRSKEFLFNVGIRMVKEYPVGNNNIEWVSELSLHNLFFNDKNISDNRKDDLSENTVYIDTNIEGVSSIRIGQGVRFWKNNFGLGIQVSYMPYRLWAKHTVPSGFNSFSIETSVNFRF
ncbi:hypothetical protein [Chryseobacterium paludis]|uniref:hypothetical protein n=1 Tax=Chryseobacterium paludis TaxID=2956784 RepID=UPI0021C24B90|nr:hypothetical protein [Chryseobacterium paludis]